MFLAVNTTLILEAIRLVFTNEYPELGALIVPYSGPHYDENVAACDARIKYVSGFSGSAGSIVITPDEALLWTDGRYWEQAKMELELNKWTLMEDGNTGVLSQTAWLLANIDPSKKVYVDSATMTKSAWDAMAAQLTTKGIQLSESTGNIVDEVWDDKVDCPKNPIIDLPLEFSGQDVEDKLTTIRSNMATEGADYLLVSELDEIAWLFNLRGTDFPRAAVFLSFAIVGSENFVLFIQNPTSLEASIRTRLQDINGTISDYTGASANLGFIADNPNTARVWLSKYVNAQMANKVEAIKQLVKLSPVMLPKAIKNDVEVEGMRAAHLRDSAAIITFFSWLTNRINVDDWNNITELSAVDQLQAFRKEGKNYVDDSFSTIAGFGANGAIIHYRPEESTNAGVNDSGLFLVDSGGLYKDGTTDITRTIHLGKPTDEQKDRYTRVLKGHVAIASAKIPQKLPGYRVDTLARKALWDIGLDYQHGTGHGIGHYLNVHEGPHRISYGYSVDDPGLQQNMFTSNEPGYYKVGEYGIRIENIVRIVNSSLEGFLEIETISFVPFENSLIKVELLTPEEITWIDQYHEDCKTKLSAFLEEADYIEDKQSVLNWLDIKTVPLEELPNEDGGAGILLVNKFSLALVLMSLFLRNFI